MRVHVDLACEREQAFRTWTERIDTWWPRGHTTTGGASRDANRAGWAGLLPHFQAACDPDAAPSPTGAR